MKILIIAHDFPPINRVASLRPFSWAKYWSKMGHEICVLTTQVQSFTAALDLNLDPETRANIRIEAIPYLSLTPRSRQVGTDVDRNTSAESPSPTHSLRNSVAARIYGFSRKSLRQVSEFLGTGSFLYASVLWILPALKFARNLYQEWPFEVVISTFGPPAAHIIAGRLKQQLPIVWVADYRDLWYQSHLVTAKWPFDRWERSLEHYFVSRADLITTVSEPLSEQLRQRFSQPVCTIENGFDLDDHQPDLETVFPNDGKVRLVYTGLFYPGKQNLSLLWQAIQLLRDQGIAVATTLEVLLYGPDFSSLIPALQEYGLTDLVKLPGFVSRSEALLIQRSADALIFLDWEVPNVAGILTGKLFEYLFSGRPILGIGATSLTAAGRVLEATGTGFPVGASVEKLAVLLQQLLAGNPLPYCPDAMALQQYTRDNLAKQLLAYIEGCKIL